MGNSTSGGDNNTGEWFQTGNNSDFNGDTHGTLQLAFLLAHLAAVWEQLGKATQVLLPYEICQCILGAILNAISLAALCVMRKRKSPFHVLLVLLASTDLFYIVTRMLACAANAANLQFFMNSVPYSTDNGCLSEVLSDLSKYCMMLPFLVTTGLVVNQAIAVARPLQYDTIVTKRRIITIFATVVMATVVMCLVLHLSVYFLNPNDSCLEHFFGTYTSVMCWCLGTLCVLLTLLNVVLYVMIYLKAHRTVKSTPAAKNANSDAEMKKLTATIALLVVTLILFWSPAVVTFFLIATLIENGYEISPELAVANISTSAASGLICIVDPIIYGIRLKEVRDGYRILKNKVSEMLRMRKRNASQRSEIKTVDTRL